MPRRSDWRLCAGSLAASSRVPIDVRPEGGARCVSSARRDLCGGRGAILVPTATIVAIKANDRTGLITWEFPRLCRGGSRSLTYTAVVLRETCDGLRHDVMRGGNKAKPKQLRSRTQQGKHRQMGLFSITSVGHLGEVPMSSWGLLGVSVIGIGDSLASPSRFERL